MTRKDDFAIGWIRPDNRETVTHRYSRDQEFVPGPPNVLDELGPGNHTYELGWIQIPNRKLLWYERLGIRFQCWWNRIRGKHTVTSWNLPEDWR